MAWEVRWTNKALKLIARMDRPQRERIVRAIEELAGTGHGDVKRLKGRKPELFRLRVGGWRVLFSREPSAKVLIIRTVRPRGDAY